MPGKEVALMRRIIVLSTLAAAMVVMLALAGSASAAKPEPQTIHEEATELIADCGDFQVLTDYVADFRYLTFFDSAGNPEYARVHFTFHEFYYNSVTGVGFAETETGTNLVDLPSDAEVTSSGLSYRVTVPGGGVVLLDAGRLVFNEAGEAVFEAGPHQVLRGDTDKLCAALA
jgi:hypothetical protein